MVLGDSVTIDGPGRDSVIKEVVVLYQSPKLPPHVADPVSKTKTPGDTSG